MLDLLPARRQHIFFENHRSAGKGIFTPSRSKRFLICPNSQNFASQSKFISATQTWTLNTIEKSELEIPSPMGDQPFRAREGSSWPLPASVFSQDRCQSHSSLPPLRCTTCRRLVRLKNLSTSNVPKKITAAPRINSQSVNVMGPKLKKSLI
jgi:hypothetical protein